MTQSVRVQPAESSSTIDGFWGHVRGCLNSSIVSRVIDAVATPFRLLASPITVVAVGLFQCYLIIDPVTSFIGIGCALLINTIVLNLLDYAIRKFWANHWNSAYGHGNENEESLKIFERTFSTAKQEHADSLTELNLAIQRFKDAERKLDSLNLGRGNAYPLTVEATDKEKEIKEAAQKKHAFIEGLFKSHLETTKPIQELKSQYNKDKIIELKEMEQSRAILNIDLRRVLLFLSSTLPALQLQLNKAGWESDTISQKSQQEKETSLRDFINNLTIELGLKKNELQLVEAEIAKQK